MITLSHQLLYGMCGKNYKQGYAPYQGVSEISDIALGILSLVAAVTLTALHYPYIACGFYASWGMTLPVVGVTAITIMKQIRFMCKEK